MRLGFIGLGQIGAPMATRWLDWGGGLSVFDVSADATAPFAEQGATVAASVAEVAAACAVVSVMVRDDAQVRDVLDGILGTAAPGTVLAVHSTVEPGTPAELAQRCETAGVHYLDAPVSGGFIGAADGTLAMLVGGDEGALEMARPAFDRQASLVVHLGPAGAGTRTKIARNLITFASYCAAAEACRLAEAAGVDVAKLGEVVRHSDRAIGGPGSIMVRDSAAPLADDDGLRPIFEHTRQLGEKDLRLAIGLGEELGVATPIAAMALDRLGAALGLDGAPA